jgi:hypothetical protein
LEVHDLAVSKLEKDINFVAALFRHRLANPEEVRERLRATPIASDQLALILPCLKRLAAP